jgi:hypothetical protein
MEVDAQIRLDKEKKLLQMQEERRIECQKQRENLEKVKKEKETELRLFRTRKLIGVTEKIMEKSFRKCKKTFFTSLNKLILDYETYEFKIQLKKNDEGKREFIQYLLLLARKRLQSKIQIERLKAKEAEELLVVLV